MAINNITQTISELPAPPHRGVDVQTLFVTKQEDFQDHLVGTTVTELNTLKDQLNTRIGEINSTTTTMNGYADTASAGASTATTKAGEASTSASEALTSRNQAETFKNNASASVTKASQWADNNYNVEVETGKYSAKHWSTVAQNATSGKIDKVTSTDNAIVRFDGTDGKVQNSGVIIDDNGNVGIGTSSPAFNLDIRNTSATGTTADNTLIQLKSSNRNCAFLMDTIGGTYTGSINNYVSGVVKSQLRFDSTGNIISVFPNGGLGYGIGSGGIVTQLTSKNYNVSLNKPTGTIITSNNALLPGQNTWFVFLNSLLNINDNLKLTPKGSTNYDIDVIDIYDGAAVIRIINRDSISHSDAISINFSIIKGAIS